MTPHWPIITAEMLKSPDRSFHKKLGQALEFRGLSQSEAARRLGTRSQTVSKLVNGDSAPGGEMLYRLAKLVGATVEELMNPEITIGDMINRMEERDAGRVSAGQMPKEIRGLPGEALSAIADAIREGGQTSITLSNYPETGSTHCVVVREGAVIYQGPERRTAATGGRRGAA